MPTRFTQKSPLPLAVAALITFGFIGCAGETRSLNENPQGNGGEGEGPSDGTGGKAGTGKGGGSDAGSSGMGTGGRSETGGSSGAGPRGGSSFAGAGAFAGAPNGGSAGSPNGGVPNGGVGAIAGFAGFAGGSSGGGPIAGSAGGAGAPSCVVRSDGTGCDGRGFCVDHELDSCTPDYDSDCSGTCAVPYLTPVCSGFGAVACPPDFACVPDTDTAAGTDPTSICVGGRAPECTGSTDCADGFACLNTPDGQRCVPDRADCRPGRICDGGIPICPPGYGPADAQLCDYVCVPFEHCGCENDIDCPQPAVCDRDKSRCLVPRAPAPRCEEPFDTGPCDAAMPVFAFVDGECKAEVYGGCEGNANRFSTLEECLSSCQGMPLEQSCQGSRKAALGCLGCGGGGGCLLWGQFCFESCESNDDCTAPYACNGGTCQIGPCA